MLQFFKARGRQKPQRFIPVIRSEYKHWGVGKGIMNKGNRNKILQQKQKKTTRKSACNALLYGLID